VSGPKPRRQLASVGGDARPDELKSADERIKGVALLLLPRLSAVIRVSRNYESDNKVFLAQLESLLVTVKPLLEDPGEAILVALQEDLYLNGVRVPVRTGNVRYHKHVVGELAKRRIAGLRLADGATPQELGVLFRLLREPDVYNGPELLSACLANGADHVAPVIHASTDSPEDAFEYDSLAGMSGSGGTTAPAEESAWDTSAEAHPYEESSGEDAGTGSSESADGGASASYAAPHGAAHKRYSSAISGARSLLTTTSLQGGMELRHAKRVVQPLVDGAFSEEPAVVGLSTLGHHDEYTYAHAVNVTLVAVSMGHFLELDRRALADLGVAALLHDVGKQVVSEDVRHPYEHFDPQDWQAVRRHPLEGAKLIARSTTLNLTTLRSMHVALEHHMTPDDDGYPDMGERWRPSILSRIVSVADCFVSLQTHRSARGTGVTPYMALGMMLGPLKPRFDPALLWALVQTVGIYPPGQLVLMDDDTVAAVLAPNAQDLARPHVRIVLDASRVVLHGEPIEWRPIPADHAIVRALRPEEYPEDPGDAGEDGEADATQAPTAS
jgi:HD-GYP domain-containing protein (c-di-GMP phosphodiesterase class II)